LNAYNIIAVAIGGSLGSVARYLVGIWSGRLLGLSFPWGTLIINVTGSFLIGLFIGLFALRWNPSEPVRVLLTVGICGDTPRFRRSRWTPFTCGSVARFGPQRPICSGRFSFRLRALLPVFTWSELFLESSTWPWVCQVKHRRFLIELFALHRNPFAITGYLGALTTFSTFPAEAVTPLLGENTSGRFVTSPAIWLDR
jgi:fluoride ion exporter CrcB/FEX